MGFARFMSSNAGRGLRIVAGLALIVLGVTGSGVILAVIGAAPLFGGPLKGANARAQA